MEENEEVLQEFTLQPIVEGENSAELDRPEVNVYYQYNVHIYGPPSPDPPPS